MAKAIQTGKVATRTSEPGRGYYKKGSFEGTDRDVAKYAFREQLFRWIWRIMLLILLWTMRNSLSVKSFSELKQYVRKTSIIEAVPAASQKSPVSTVNP